MLMASAAEASKAALHVCIRASGRAAAFAVQAFCCTFGEPSTAPACAWCRARVALTGVVAFLMMSMLTTTDSSQAVVQLRNGIMLTEMGKSIYMSPIRWVIMLAPLAFVFYLSFRVYKMSVGAAQISFWLFAAVMGASLSSIFLIYTGQSIVQVFFVTAAAFAGLSLYGYTTKKDLTGWGSFLIMGLIGIILAAIVNIFLQSSTIPKYKQ